MRNLGQLRLSRDTENHPVRVECDFPQISLLSSGATVSCWIASHFGNSQVEFDDEDDDVDEVEVDQTPKRLVQNGTSWDRIAGSFG